MNRNKTITDMYVYKIICLKMIIKHTKKKYFVFIWKLINYFTALL